AAVLYLALRRRGLRVAPKRPGREALLVLRVGAPAAVERGLFSLGHGLYLASLGRCGEPQLTAHTLGVRVESLAFLPAFALATYASSVVGNEVGAGRVAEAKVRGWEAAKASAAFMTLAGLALAAAAPLAAEALAPSRHVARLVVVYLLLAAATEPALGLVMSLAGALRGAGETRLPTLVNLAVLYGVRVAPSWLLAPRLGGDCCAVAAWLLMDLDVVVRAAVFTFIYRRMFERLARRVV
ncbi:MAG: MATE family efflux transporter, partial [Crenarchaeota archaeon]|nr:MATE family efflux transporter [Thermoproteota archaeon]